MKIRIFSTYSSKKALLFLTEFVLFFWFLVLFVRNDSNSTHRYRDSHETLTGDAEAEDIVILLHELLQQGALPCPGRAAEHHRPGSSHSWGRDGEASSVEETQWVGLEDLSHRHRNPLAWVTENPDLSGRTYVRDVSCVKASPRSAGINVLTRKKKPGRPDNEPGTSPARADAINQAGKWRGGRGAIARWLKSSTLPVKERTGQRRRPRGSEEST